MPPDNTGRIQGRFQRGRSGNPAGRPRGARNVTTVTCEALLNGEGEQITRTAIRLAKKGHPIALRLCLERLYPAPKDKPVTFPLRPICNARDAADALSDLARAAASGEITPSDAEAMAKVMGHAVKAFEIAEMVERTTRPERLSDEELFRIIQESHAKQGPTDARGNTSLLTFNAQ